MPDSITVTIPTHFQQSKKKRVFLGLNFFRNAHFLVLSKAKVELHELAVALLSKYIPTAPYKGRYKITSTYNFENKVSDLDNSVLLIKYVNDSLQKLGIVKSDNVDACVEVRLLVGEKQVKGEGNCVITVDFLD